jgi:aryl-alcohol dehydrogenase (NADP+)
MSFGESARGPHEWTLDEDASRPIIRAALEAGITTYDTADQYSAGSSEEIVGRALGEFARRDEIVIATKVFFPTGAGPNTGGLSRKHVMAAIDASLTRLGTDYVDLYQIHRFDPDVTVEETMEAPHDVVVQKARYIGARAWTAVRKKCGTSPT